MGHEWTDTRDETRWDVRNMATGAMATGGEIPDAGRTMIRFRGLDVRGVSEVYDTENPFSRAPEEMTDSELQTLLDRARAGRQ